MVLLCVQILVQTYEIRNKTQQSPSFSQYGKMLSSAGHFARSRRHIKSYRLHCPSQVVEKFFKDEASVQFQWYAGFRQ